MLEVKFNIARAYYDDGDFEKARRALHRVRAGAPDHKDAPVAGNLALDALRQLNDFKGIEATGKKFLANSQLPAELPRARCARS